MVDKPDTFEAKSYRNAGLLFIYLVIAAIVFVLIKALVFDQPLNERALQQALIAAGVGVTVTCLIVWLLNLLQILSIQAGWGKLLWGVLITSILGNSALVYKRFSTDASPANLIRLACMKTLDVGDGPSVKHPYAIKTSMGYRPGERLSYFAAFTDFALNDAQELNVEFRTSIEDIARRRSIFWDDAFKANYKKMLEDPARKARTEEYRKVAPECVGPNTVQAAFIYQLPDDLPPGPYLIRVTIKDKTSGAIASDAISIETQNKARSAGQMPAASGIPP